MRALFSFLTILLSTAFFVTGVVYVIGKTFGSLVGNPESKAFKRVLDNLRNRLKAASAELVPWDGEMLSLLSLNRINEKKPGWFRAFSMGQYTTIYHEPVVAYATQRFGNVSVTVIRTSDREYVLRRKGKETEIWLNNQPLGLLVDGALLSPGKKSQLLARLDRKPEEAQHPLLLGDAPAVTLNNP
ncbi:MAG: hypothetical protein JNK89_09870, partial [Saprospiraceae bacterium]|nr:hypothetical protein [Saprospiraceae bacterium]